MRKKPLALTVACLAAATMLASVASASAYAAEPAANPLSRSVMQKDDRTDGDTEARYTASAGELDSLITTATELLSSSAGHVDDESSRQALQQAVDAATSLKSGWEDRVKVFGDVMSVASDLFDKQASELKTETNAVNAAVKSHDDRIAAEQAAYQARMAAQQTAQARYSSASSGYSGYSGYSGGDASNGYTTSASCELQAGTAAPCQSAVDGGGLVQQTWGDVTIYAGHSNTGWSWINNLTAGQTVTINGQQYQVTGESQEGAVYAPDSGTWMQTCNGNGNHLVGIRPVG